MRAMATVATASLDARHHPDSDLAVWNGITFVMPTPTRRQCRKSPEHPEPLVTARTLAGCEP
jgi:hypothetical protein